MNKKMYIIGVPIIIITLLLIGFNMLGQGNKIVTYQDLKGIAFSSTEEIELVEDAAAYQLLEDKRIEVATLLKSTAYPLLGEDEEYYQINFGNDRIYILKKDAVKQPANAEFETFKSEYTVLSESSLEVLDTAERGAKVVARINPDMRVVVLEEIKSRYRIQIGGMDRYIYKKDTVEDSGVPALMYHHMIENAAQSSQSTNRMVIDVKNFEEQMDFLVKNHWTPISMQTFQQWKEKEIDLPKKVVLLTFDDGILSTVKYAYPILKAHNMPAASFLIMGKIRQEAAPWDPETLQNVGLKEIKATTDVYDYQHHTHYFHVFKKGTSEGLMITDSYEAIMQDLDDGKHQLAKAFDGDTERVTSLAYLSVNIMKQHFVRWRILVYYTPLRRSQERFY
ncbi:polysaccharide deacetylase family protein [Sporosarcina sp. G11-34]|uniref:polysaccharide deacetylase family protein n=1 Tax=Sporosarcina sp. G11-34 TaxID=2849605 RepID=UPI0022A9E4D1|nr:polysaccharide deacetylase family protein [Sporosarcina sp. G11-34]MCZ2257594.1 polysaccharide deacetylase family protein [Sporosarcina sp. G11-34]